MCHPTPEEQVHLDKHESRKFNGECYQWWSERKVHKYQFWARKPELYKDEPLGLPYVFLDHGFFDLVWVSMLPIHAVGHLIYLYALYHLVHYNLWFMLPLCKQGKTTVIS